MASRIGLWREAKTVVVVPASLSGIPGKAFGCDNMVRLQAGEALLDAIQAYFRDGLSPRPPNEHEAAQLIEEHIAGARAVKAISLNVASCAPFMTETTPGIMHILSWAQDNNAMTQGLKGLEGVEALKEVRAFMREHNAGSLAAYESLHAGAGKRYLAYTAIVTKALDYVLSGRKLGPFLFDSMPASDGKANTDNDKGILTSAAFTTDNAASMSSAFLARQLSDKTLGLLVVQSEVNLKLLRGILTTCETLTDAELLGFRRDNFSFSSGPEKNKFGIYKATFATPGGWSNSFLVMFVPSLGTGFSIFVGEITCGRNLYCLRQMGKWMDKLLGRKSFPDAENPLSLVCSLGKEQKKNMAVAQAVVGDDGLPWKSPCQLGGEASAESHGPQMRNGGKATRGNTAESHGPQMRNGGKASAESHGPQMRNGGNAHGVEHMRSLGKKGSKKMKCNARGCTAAKGTCPGRYNQKNCLSKASGATPITKYFSKKK